MEFVLTPDEFGGQLHWGGAALQPTLGVLRGPASRLLTVLETSLGLVGPPIDVNLRAARLVPSLEGAEGFFAASAAVDPLGTALRLIEWRDTLWMQGWRGEPSTSRLTELARATVDVDDGIPDRLLAVEAALRHGDSGLERVVLTEPANTLPWLWREVLEALVAQGTEVIERRFESVQISNDIRRLLHGRNPSGDGSLQRLHASGPRRSADAVAAWLAAQSDWEGTVIIGGDAVLDHALRRHGLPVVGAREVGNQPLTQALRLSLALGWSPADPERALELLTLPQGPVPPSIGRRLLGALQKWPAVGSPDWQTALAEGVKRIESVERRNRIEARLSVLFESTADEHYPVELARRKAKALLRWARGCRDNAAAANLALIAGRFSELLDTVSAPILTASQLEQMLMPAEGFSWERPTWRAEAGIHAVAQPGAVLGPARRVIWWSFNRERVRNARPELPLYREEFEALREQGVVLQQPLDRAARQTVWWERPLRQTEAQLLLVCPEHGEDGTRLHAHPLWDALTCRLSAVQVEALTVTMPTMGTACPSVPRDPRPRPAPRRKWSAGRRLMVTREGPESPSSLETLLGCNLAYTLRYLLRVRPSRLGSLSDGPRLLGNLAHQVLGNVLADPNVRSPKDLAAAAATMFDAEGPQLAAALFRPGADAERGKVRGIIERAAASIGRWVEEQDLRVVGTETLGQTRIAGREVKGRADLLVGRARGDAVGAVVDLKWGSKARHRAALVDGVAVQLLSYARAFQSGSVQPEIAYFILSGGTLLAGRDAEVVRGHLDLPEVQEVWDAFEDSVAEAFERLASGALEAPGNPDADGETVESSQRTDGRIVLAPKCDFCDYAGLCGRHFEVET
ncbi:MAG: PD-(D/E)XK nuclease family protein [Nannocystaceae bacterium]|nr:PD-(D/E)XK nuclease family protein [bacterium]